MIGLYSKLIHIFGFNGQSSSELLQSWSGHPKQFYLDVAVCLRSLSLRTSRFDCISKSIQSMTMCFTFSSLVFICGTSLSMRRTAYAMSSDVIISPRDFNNFSRASEISIKLLTLTDFWNNKKLKITHVENTKCPKTQNSSIEIDEN